MSQNLVSFWRRLIAVRASWQIVAAVEEDCWTSVRAKAAVLPKAEAAEYVRAHAATQVHREVDRMVRSNATLDGERASELIVQATERLTRRLLERLERGKRRAA
jgi:hypothetical protein